MAFHFTTASSSWEEGDSGEDEEEDEDVSLWLPISVSLVLVVLFSITLYMSKRRRRQLREAGLSDPMRAVSGGVPMNVNVYRNYGVYVNSLHANMTPSTSIPPTGDLCTIPYSNDAPPAYEDIIKDDEQAVPSTSRGISLTAPNPALGPPPSYTPTGEMDPSTVRESTNGISEVNAHLEQNNSSTTGSSSDLHLEMETPLSDRSEDLHSPGAKCGSQITGAHVAESRGHDTQSTGHGTE